MLSLAIRKQIDSEKMVFSEFKDFIGKNVIISITEEENQLEKKAKFSEFFKLV